MAFADLFSAESIGNLMQDPRMVLGLQLLSQGRQGSGSQALGQAGSQAALVLQEQRRQQELGDYRNNLARMQQEQLQMQQQAAQAKAQQQTEYRARLQDPAFLQSLSPMARQMAQLGVDPAELIRATNADNLAQHRQAQLQQQQAQFDTRESRIGANAGSSGPRAPAPRAFVDQPLGGDQYQRFQYDPATGGYKPWGEPFNKHSQRKATTGADAATEAIMGAEAEPVPDMSALPGTGSLGSYMPKQGPVGVMAAQGGGAAVKQAPKAGMRVPGQPKVARPLTAEDYAALPSGTQYIDPVSGRTATKR
ncbi:hypothetical protein [Pseudomonas sp. ABFPK]|uniref:hypothetical protein n=1 Tax=Pseudomonas sp. ABFPK TaxID=1636605 RepID=UPI000778D97A|nr:hypothetical protein [Pseudomonas sp. ABFPK]KYC14212.1 hypothetical protein WM94_27095 [Pseudomonas sp. ABFPK]